MRIAESSINMLSGRNFAQAGVRAGGNAYDSAFLSMANRFGMKQGSTAKRDSYEPGLKNCGAGSYNMSDINYFKGLEKIAPENTTNPQNSAAAFRNQTLTTLLQRLASFGMFSSFGSGGFSQNLVTYSEVEETGFQASGQVKTEDGRTIDFNVSIMMSRSYTEYMNISMPMMNNALFDPLIINTGSGFNTADIRDQTFKFDLDADGFEDEISMLGKGSGFLALDKNGNGKIDDGNELFGARTGDGFGELREYDSDGNGWIDENDDIFSKLKVWSRDENGNDVLMDLKQADIGAIYLGEQQTEFTMGGADGIRDGVIRSTGLFIRESGSVGALQHVDLAMKQEGQEEKISGEETVSNVSTSGNRPSQNSTSRMREERRRRKEKTMQEKSAKKEAEEARLKRQLEKQAEMRKYEQKMKTKHLEEMKEYSEELRLDLLKETG